jgi:hypothetical protein
MLVSAVFAPKVSGNFEFYIFFNYFFNILDLFDVMLLKINKKK